MTLIIKELMSYPFTINGVVELTDIKNYHFYIQNSCSTFSLEKFGFKENKNLFLSIPSTGVFSPRIF